jgi:ubiquinol-cytochrome c reductase subunit 7
VQRAIDCNMKKTLLPKDQWTTTAQDLPYLTPYLQDVELEVNERVLWRDSMVGIPSWVQPAPEW